ncbi:DsrE family protein [Saccharicrinis fermentans]|uniref:Selenium metabolism protein YedF n=1 Tax=Saccharicrinis fermentans DSM 9555 = JCM 21142 TaxID=869213 RepID=W7Y0I8_9BACT|nr:DsrE family protein [Saccharicrinis fermentans]GAF04430.1 selenium metabolism protein YedF [Saccharicrinis fermentans DSM 9555 = JCM 21142]
MKNTLIQITKNGMGEGDEALSLSLIANYLKLVNEESNFPLFMSFYNGGVKLLCEGSPVIDTLKLLEKKGVKMLACKTCLNYYHLLDKRMVGVEATMVDIVSLQKVADKVINL